jgi:hypothetical protein
MNGIALIERLREINQLAPAILITTFPSAALRKRAATAGIPIVEKPILGGALLDCIHRAMMPPAPRLH